MTRRQFERRAVTAAAFGAVVGTGGRQAEGTRPVPQDDQPNRIEDVSRDLKNVARKDPNGRAELLDDLTNLENTPRPAERLGALAQSLSDALGGTNLPDAEAKRLADLLFVARTPGNLSGAQIEQVGTELQETLITVGVGPEPAGRVSAAAIALAKDGAANPKRWYHR